MDTIQRPASDAPTIVDVAQLAGVSVATVSRVVNDKRHVSVATRRKVQAAVASLGFTPLASAQRLSSRRSRAISLLFPRPPDSAATSMISVIGAATASGELDYFLNLVTEPVGEQRLLTMYRSGLIDGVILAEVTKRDWRVALLTEQQLPFVTIGRPASTAGLWFVDFDYEAAVGALFDFLVDLGHQRIAFVGWPPSETGFGPAIRYQQGFNLAVARHGIDAIALHPGSDAMSVAQATRRLLAEGPKPTAIVCVSRQATFGVLQAVRDLRLSVPGDVAVASVCTDEFAALMTPTVTNADFPSRELGYRAASMLIGRLDAEITGGAQRPDQVILPPTVTVRSSAGPPGGRPSRER